MLKPEMMETTFNNPQAVNETEQLVDLLLAKYISLSNTETE
jgi:hypothetical protein